MMTVDSIFLFQSGKRLWFTVQRCGHAVEPFFGTIVAQRAHRNSSNFGSVDGDLRRRTIAIVHATRRWNRRLWPGPIPRLIGMATISCWLRATAFIAGTSKIHARPQ